MVAVILFMRILRTHGFRHGQQYSYGHIDRLAAQT